MLSYTYKSHNKFELTDKPKPELIDSRDAIVRVVSVAVIYISNTVTYSGLYISNFYTFFEIIDVM